MLRVLVAQEGEILSKATLMDAAWPDVIVEENNLNQAISLIRKVLGDSKSASRFIQTIPGRGYRFSAPVTVTAVMVPVEDEPALPAAPASPHEGTPQAATFLPRRQRALFRPAMLFVLAALAFVLLYHTLPNENGDDVLQVQSTELSDKAFSASNEAELTDVPLIHDSIAVLPFTLLNSRTDSELFAFGLHDEIINQLSKIHSLNVIARNSIVRLTRDQPSIAEIGHRLGVEAIITGTILFKGEQGEDARVSLQMLEPDSGIILWASTHQVQASNLTELVNLYRDIALNVSTVLEVPVSSQERQALEALPTTSFAAYRYHLAANAAYYALDYLSAWTLSKQAITLDPYYYDALYTYASVNTVLIGAPLPQMNSRQHHAMALETAQRMIEVAPRRTEGHALKASVHGTSRDWLKVAESMEELRALNASLSDMRFLASVLLCLGDFAGAIEILQANLRVEPVNLYARGFLMMAHELAGNRLQARQEYELGETLTPLWWGDTVEIFLALGRRETLRDIGEQYGLSEELVALLHAVNAGDSDSILPVLERFRQHENHNGAETLFYAAIAAYEGQQELALELTRHALDESWLTLHWLWLPVFDEVRALQDFQTLLVESGLPAYWQKYGWPEMCQAQADSFHCDWKAYP